MRVLYTDAAEFPLPEELAHLPSELGLELSFAETGDANEVRTLGKDVDAILLFRARVTAQLIDDLPRCRLFARVGTGYDLIDVGAAKDRGRLVTYVPGFATEELSDHVLMFVLAFAHQLPVMLDAQRRHYWPRNDQVALMPRLANQTLGILGFGRSGQRTAEKAAGLGLRVAVWTRHPDMAQLEEIGATTASFAAALASDFVSIHLPATSETDGLIGEREFSLMRQTAVLINVARGSIVQTAALVTALRDGHIRGAGLDVVSPAPLPADHPLWSLPNVLMTFHSGGVSREGRVQVIEAALREAAGVLRGEAPRFPVPEMVAPSRQPPNRP